MRKEVLKRVSRILRFACMTAWVSVGIGCEELDDTFGHWFVWRGARAVGRVSRGYGGIQSRRASEVLWFSGRGIPV